MKNYRVFLKDEKGVKKIEAMEFSENGFDRAYKHALGICETLFPGYGVVMLAELPE